MTQPPRYDEATPVYQFISRDQTGPGARGRVFKPQPNMESVHRRTRNGILALIAVLIAAGWVIISLPFPGQHDLQDDTVAGLILGTMFGHVSLSSAWCALGPLALMRRLPIAFAWLAAVAVVFGFNLAQGPRGDLLGWLIFTCAMLIQWTFTQTPLWLLVFYYGWHMSQAAANTGEAHGNQQFGIRHLMVLTVLVALVLGGGRLALGGLEWRDWRGPWTVLLIYIAIAVSNAILSLPMIIAPALYRRPVIGSCGAICLAVIVTLLELPLFYVLVPGPADWKDYWIVCCLNIFQSAWILGIVLLLRVAGYRLMTRSRPPIASTTG